MNPIDPVELALADKVLEYAPTIKREKPPGSGVPSAVPPPAIPPAAVPSTTLAASLIATWNDVQAISNWYSQALPAARSELSGVTAPVASDALSASEQLLLTTALGSQTITFSDALAAYEHPETPHANLILTAWDRAHFGYDGQLGALLYFDLARLADAQLPVLIDTTRRLIDLSAYAMLGSDSVGASTQDQLESLGQLALDGSSTLSHQELIGYTKLHDTVATQVSDLTYVTGVIKDAIDTQLGLPQQAEQLIAGMGGAFNLGGGSLGSEIGAIIAALSGLRTLFELVNAAEWLSFSGLRTRLDQLAQQLIIGFISRAALAFSHVQNQLAYPVINLIRRIEHALAGKQSQSIDQGLDSLVVLISSVVGKFEQHMLDMYRHTWLHNQLTSTRAGAASSQGKMRNLIKTLGYLITGLQELQSSQTSGGWIGFAKQVGADVGIKDISLPKLPVLTITKPPPSATLDDAIKTPTQQTGLALADNPASVVSGLLNDMRGSG